MNKTLQIEGMTSSHCKAKVEALLKRLKEISTAVVDLSDGTAEIVGRNEISDAILMKTLAKGGYSLVSIAD